MKENKFIVIKGRNTVVGKYGLHYEIYDTVNFICSEKELQKFQRRYVYYKLYHVDHKLKPIRFRRDVNCRRRHLLKGDGTIFAEKVKIFDYQDGTYYGFIPVEAFNF
jgi:hypothetical protein